MSQHGGVCCMWGMVRVGWRISYLSCLCDKNTGQKQFKAGRVYSGSQFEDTARCGIRGRGEGAGKGQERGREGIDSQDGLSQAAVGTAEAQPHGKRAESGVRKALEPQIYILCLRCNGPPKVRAGVWAACSHSQDFSR